MKMIRFFLLALALLSAPVAALAQDQDIVVRGDAARLEIERILQADSLDSAQPSPREVASAMATIARGGAPQEFWNAYQLHVQAWATLADAVDNSRSDQAESSFGENRTQLAEAAAAIDTTFDEVERIARLYHARLPRPLVDTRTIA